MFDREAWTPRSRLDPKVVEHIQELIKASGLEDDHWLIRLITFRLKTGHLHGLGEQLRILEERARNRLGRGGAPFSILSKRGDGISLGITTDGVRQGQDLAIPTSTFARHAGIFGLTGSGKTYFMMGLAQQLMAAGITVWIFDRSRDFRRIVSASSNPPLLYLRPEWLLWNMLQAPGSILAWINTLVERMSSVFFSRGGSSVVLSSSLQQLYRQQQCREGGEQWPTLDEWWLHLSLSQPSSRSREFGYYESAQRVLRAVHDGFPTSFNRKQSVPLAEFAKTSIVMDVSDLSTLQYLFLLMLLLEQTSSEKYGQSLQRVVFIDEASEIFNEQQVRRQDQGYPPQHDLPRRFRGRGIGLVLADQTPSLLPRDVQANLGTIVVFRLLNQACIKAVTASAGMSPEQVSVIAALPPQHAVVHSIDLGKPYLVSMPPMEFSCASSRADLEARRREFVPAWMVENVQSTDEVNKHHSEGAPSASSTSSEMPVESSTQASQDPQEGRNIKSEPASSKEKHHASASPQGEYATKDILTAADYRFLERLARFPQETIVERCTAERMDNMSEWIIRKKLLQLGYVILAGKIGKVEFFGLTDKGLHLAQQRGIVIGTWKSGIFHEIIVRRIEEALQRQAPEYRASRGGQFDGVQPDVTITAPSGGCLAIQVSVANKSSYEAECAARLAKVASFSKVVVFVCSNRKLLEVRKALSREFPDGLFSTGTAGKVEVLHARAILEHQVDWRLRCEASQVTAVLDVGRTPATKVPASEELTAVGWAAVEDTPGGEVEHDEPEGWDKIRKGTASPEVLGEALQAAEQGEAAGRSQACLEGLTPNQDGLGLGGRPESSGTAKAGLETLQEGEPPGTAEKREKRSGEVLEGLEPVWEGEAEDPEAKTAKPGKPEGSDGDELAGEGLQGKAEDLEAWAAGQRRPEGAEAGKGQVVGLDGEGLVCEDGNLNKDQVVRIDAGEEAQMKVGSIAAAEPRHERLLGETEPEPVGLAGTEGSGMRSPRPKAEGCSGKKEGSSGSEPLKTGTGKAGSGTGSEIRTPVEEPSEERAEDRQWQSQRQGSRQESREAGRQGERDERAKASEEVEGTANGQGPEPEPEQGTGTGTRTRKRVSSVEEGQCGARTGANVSGDYPPQERDYPRQGRGRRNPRAARDDDAALQRTGRKGNDEEGDVGDADLGEGDLIGVSNGDDNVRTTVVVKGGACAREKKKGIQGQSLSLKVEKAAGDPPASDGIDLSREHVISLREATAWLPKRAGKKLHISTLYRWIQAGVKGEKLETIRVGGMQCTSVEALQRFCSRLSDQQPERVPLRIRQGLRKRRTDDILSQAGLLGSAAPARSRPPNKRQEKAVVRAEEEPDGSA